MIPRRICLRGFLSYREEQEVDFSGSTLWMLGGPNGSGKSAVFDAVTYALFGVHRGGSLHAAKMINKDADVLQVEFDFLLDGHLYRARKTLRKSNRGSSQATQQISHFAERDGRPGRWEPVGDTNRKTEYDRWLRERLGLTYETFTSSVLLLQGRAEKLLDSAAKGRFEVLAGIVDLARYARLHEKVDERRRNLKARAEATQGQIAALPEVADAEMAAADELIATSEAALGRARAEVERCRAAELHAQRWAELQVKSTGMSERLRQADTLLAGAHTIERDAARLAELTVVLRHIEAVIKQRGQITESQRQSESLEARRKAARDRRSACEHALAQAHQKRTALQKAITADEQQIHELQASLRRLEGLRAQIKLLEQQRGELERREAELACLPANVHSRLATAEAERDASARAATAAPVLAHLLQARDQLESAGGRERHAASQERSIKARGEHLSKDLAALVPRLEAKSAERQRTDVEVSAAAALLEQALAEEKAFRDMEGARVCRQCGQDLTPAHFARELAKRREEAAEAESRSRTAVCRQSSARDAEADLRRQVVALEKERQEKREEYRDVGRQLEQAREDVSRLSRECSAAYDELAEPYRGRIAPDRPADWAAVMTPMADQLAEVRAEAGKLAAAEQAVRLLREQQMARTTVSGQVQTLRQGVENLRAALPGEPDELHRDFARTESEEQAVSASLRAARTEVLVVQDEIDRIATERQSLDGDISAIDGDLQLEEAKRHHARQNLDSATASLPELWRASAGQTKLSELHALKGEREKLAERRVDEKARELQQVRVGLEPLREMMAELNRELEAIPAEARRPADEVRDALDSAGRDHDDCEERFRQARQLRAVLDERHRDREKLQTTALDLERQLKHYSLLTELLGRDRLQLYLVRRAERQIVDHANAVLDRLSGGQLFLRLRPGSEGDEPDKALDLEAYNRVTGGSGIGVAFLSGSQRFRVAVSLALGIGQYASRQHRPIESVIIDEGFGCLDRDGRQVMIQELQNLRGHLKCILVVSHQEEFAEAFNDGYRFELIDGTTRVTRVGKGPSEPRE
jgi:DNA repair exonuclease SbcCD ATPase subunit